MALQVLLSLAMSPKVLPVSQVTNDAQWFDSAEAAAHAATQNSDPKVEKAGFIVSRPDGKFAFSTPATQDSHDNFAFRAQIQQGHKLAGLYHNHPGNDSDADSFSPRDVNVANKLKVPSFIRVNSTNTVRRYTPGKSTTFAAQIHAGDDGVMASMGDVVPPPAPSASPSAPGLLAQAAAQ